MAMHEPMSQQMSLAVRSPFELRVDFGKDVPETDVRKALAGGDMGFVHSFTTGSTVDGPGVRVVAGLIGMDAGPVRDFARRLAARKRPVWLRYVLVPGWTDDREDVARLAGFAADLGNVERVDALPFHQLGSFKWKQLGIEYKLQDAAPLQRNPLRIPAPNSARQA